MTVATAERLLLVSVAGLDWAGFRDAVARGLVPNLAALAARGGAAPLPTAAAETGVAAWTALATGAPTHRHGVFEAEEAAPAGLRAVGRGSWAVAPLWERLEVAGISTAGVAWPAARPGDAWSGRHVDDSFAVATGRGWDDWALPLHCAAPTLREALRDLRVHPADVGAAQLLPLVPGLAAIDQEREPGLALLAVAMAQAASVQAAAAWLLAETDARAVFVHHRWLGDVRERVLADAPPPWDRLEAGAWRFLDGLVGRLAGLAGAGARIMVVSPGQPGTLIAAGTGVAAVEGRCLTDIAAMIAASFGLAALPEVVMPPAAAAGPDLARLVAQGYAPPPGPPPRWRAAHHAGRSRLLLPHDAGAAGAAADAALAIDPDHVDALSLRAAAHVALGEAEALTPIADALLRLAPQRPWGALVQGARHALRGDAAAAAPWLRAAEAMAEPETTLKAAAAWLMLKRADEAARGFAAVLTVRPGNADAMLGLAAAALARGDLFDAEQRLRNLLAVDPGNRSAWHELATVLERGGRLREAAAARRAAQGEGTADALRA